MKSIIKLTILFILTLSFLSGCSGWESTQRGGRINLTYLHPDTRFENAVKANKFDESIKYANSQNVNRMVDGDYPVVRAASRGEHRSALALGARGANLQVKNGRGESLAFIAAHDGNREAAQTYADRGAGTMQDVEYGYQQWVAKEPERKRRQEQNLLVAGAIIGALMGGDQNSQSDGSDRCNSCGGFRGVGTSGDGLCASCLGASLHQ